MKHGFVKAAAVTPKIKVADTVYNREQICMKIREAYEKGAKIIVFPELCLCGYTCEDLFLQGRLLNSCKEQLSEIVGFTKGMKALVFVGLPMEREGKLYNVAAAICDGRVLAFIPKTFIPAYGEFYETRHFAVGNQEAVPVLFYGEEVYFGTNILLQAEKMEGLVMGCEICEDIWVPKSPGIAHTLAGATVLVNLSASNETVGKDAHREMLVKAASAKQICGYIYAGAGEGESTQDLVFGGQNIIAECGSFLAKSTLFDNGILYGDLDVSEICMERRRMNTFGCEKQTGYRIIPFALHVEETKLDRKFPAMPFVPSDEEKKKKRCEEILSIQSLGLKKRYEHTGCQKAVIGVSGGLDSTLALLVTARCFDMLGLKRENIFAITMPCFGTTDRTYENACRLAKVLGATLEEVDIKEALILHFNDIGHDIGQHNVTYENSQARERTQVLMDIANRENGMVIGTGDLSELALGWATYNGDHMSMYGVNAGVPKTLIRHLVHYYAETCKEKELKPVLLDVLDTPVSPELLPPTHGTISQKTEELVGPYKLHDFFLYYMLRKAYEPAKIYRIAKETFQGEFDEEVILKWMKIFYRRFFAQQFKRSCLPDGPKVGSVGISPRGDLRMPSDACARIWLEQIENL